MGSLTDRRPNCAGRSTEGGRSQSLLSGRPGDARGGDGAVRTAAEIAVAKLLGEREDVPDGAGGRASKRAPVERPPPLHQQMAELDPEAGNRRKQIDMLRQRMRKG